MPLISRVAHGFYRIKLPQVLTDSTHGEMSAFELITVQVRDSEGADGVGYTYTVGRNGAAVHAVLSREIPELVAGQDADRIKALWHKLWWALHYGDGVLTWTGRRASSVTEDAQPPHRRVPSALRLRRRSGCSQQLRRPDHAEGLHAEAGIA